MNQNDWVMVGIGILIGLGVAYFFLWGQPYSNLQNKYQSLQQNYSDLQKDYQELNQSYSKLKEECDEIKKSTRELLTQYLTREVLWEISGISKYRRLIEVLGIIIKTY